MNIVQLKANDYDELLDILNNVFSIENKRQMDFEKEIPKMCKRSDEHVGKHYAVKEDGKIVSVVGIYPFEVEIMGQKFNFATVGNMVTDPEYSGRGYMSGLYEFAADYLKKHNIDASRLGGLRSRYNRFGYEVCGMEYNFSLNLSAAKKHGSDTKNITFKEIRKEDKELLEYTDILNQKSKYFAKRYDGICTDDIYDTLSAWKTVPYLAYYEDGTKAGYICASQNPCVLSEIRAENMNALKDIIFSYQKFMGREIRFTIPLFYPEGIRYFCSVSSGMSLHSPCMFNIINMQGICDAFMKLNKHLHPHLPDGNVVIEIKGEQVLEFYCTNGDAGCVITDKKPDFSMEKFMAQRYIFGPFDPISVCDKTAFSAQWFPLPFSWSTHDRL